MPDTTHTAARAGAAAAGLAGDAPPGRGDGASGAADVSGAVDRIRLTGIAATGYHGVLEHERRDGQPFVADVVLHVDTRAAAEVDRLELTVDYGVLAEDVAAVLAGPPADLIETVAERIAAVALEREQVAAVDVVLHKPQAPVTVPFADVAVEIHRDRRHMPSVSRRVQRHVAEVPTPSSTPVPTPPETPPALEPDTSDLPADLPADLLAPALPLTPAGPVAPVPPLTPADLVAPALPLTPPPPPPAPAPVDRMDVAPDGPVEAVVALGSNLGASQDILRDAVAALRAVPGVALRAVAPMARTAPVGGPDQQDYLNTVVVLDTTLSPRALLRACQDLEQRFGRVRDERWGPRTLDVDVITHGATVGVTDDLELPHPRAHERAFVLIPWAHVDPGAVLPGLGGGPVAVLAETAPDRDGIRWMALDWWGAEARP